MTIYYIYRKDNGEYAGSGTPKIDNETHGNTTIAHPEYDFENNEIPYWDGKKWEVRKIAE
jgi:hypothetical protein